MKVYTKTGDNGSTSLAGGKRVAKNHPRVEAYGTLDELIAHIGVVRSYLLFPFGCQEKGRDLPTEKVNNKLDTSLSEIQKTLMTLSSHLADGNTDTKTASPIPMIQESILALERAIDATQEQLPPLQTFVVPGPPAISAHCHVARTVCRRTERTVVTLGVENTSPQTTTYLNRLSDYLFVLSRFFAEGSK